MIPIWNIFAQNTDRQQVKLIARSILMKNIPNSTFFSLIVQGYQPQKDMNQLGIQLLNAFSF